MLHASEFTRTKVGRSYSEVASEYYDPVRHPTCADLRRASALLLERLWARLPLCLGVSREVGCGKSLIAELLVKKTLPADQLTVSDSSPEMLAWSTRFESHGAQLEVSDAADIPQKAGSVRCLFSILGDPYNHRGFWREAARVLGSRGIAIFTTPSYDWAHRFRQALLKPDEFATSEFERADGRSVLLPSIIYPPGDQKRLIIESGLFVQEVASITLRELGAHHLSRKLDTELGDQQEVATAYLALKQ